MLSLFIPINSKIGFESRAEDDPVMAKTIKIMIICFFEVIFQRSLNDAIFFYCKDTILRTERNTRNEVFATDLKIIKKITSFYLGSFYILIFLYIVGAHYILIGPIIILLINCRCYQYTS